MTQHGVQLSPCLFALAGYFDAALGDTLFISHVKCIRISLQLPDRQVLSKDLTQTCP